MSFLKLVDLDALSRFKAKIMQIIPSAWAGSTSAGGPATIANGLPSGKVDSTSTATAFTATISGITEYYDGLTIVLKNGIVTSASGFTLNINGLGAKPSYSNMATGNDITPTAPTRDTTIFNINYTMIFVYSVDVVDGGGWVCYRGYDANTNTLAYQVRTQAVSLPMDSVTYRYRLLFQSVNGKKFVPANNSNSTNATASRTVIQTPIDPFGLIMYYGTTASVAAGAKPNSSYLWQQYNGISLGYSFNRTGATLTMTTSLPIYLKCAPQSNGSAIIDSTTPFVQALPSTADGKIYIFLGIAESATAMMLMLEHPVYEYVDGAVRQWTNAAKPTIPSPSSATPQALGTASPGSSTNYSRADHVHAMPTASNVGAIPAPANPLDDQILVYRQSSGEWQASDFNHELSSTSAVVYSIVHDDDSSANLYWIHCDRTALARDFHSSRKVLFLYGTVICYLKEFDPETQYLTIQGVRFTGMEEVTFFFYPTGDSSEGFMGSMSTLHKDDILTLRDGKSVAAIVEVDGNTIITTIGGDPVTFTDLMTEFTSVKSLEIGLPNTGIYDASVGRIIDYDYNTSKLRVSVLTTYNDIIMTFQETNGVMVMTDSLMRPLDAIPKPGSASIGDFLMYDGDSWEAASVPVLPTVSASDNGKVLRVVNGAWTAVSLPSASGVSF